MKFDIRPNVWNKTWTFLYDFALTLASATPQFQLKSPFSHEIDALLLNFHGIYAGTGPMLVTIVDFSRLRANKLIKNRRNTWLVCKLKFVQNEHWTKFSIGGKKRVMWEWIKIMVDAIVHLALIHMDICILYMYSISLSLVQRASSTD